MKDFQIEFVFGDVTVAVNPFTWYLKPEKSDVYGRVVFRFLFITVNYRSNA